MLALDSDLKEFFNQGGSDRIVIALAGDKDFFAHLAACVESLLFNCGEPEQLFIIILDGGLENTEKNTLKWMAAKRQVKMRFEEKALEQYKNFPIKSRIASASTYLRISLAEILPEEIRYVLYIDSDTIVEVDIRQILQDVKDQYFGVWAVEDISSSRAHKLLGIPKNQYFNAGVMLINLDYWRQYEVGEKIRRFKLENNDKVLGNDGGAINGVLWNSWGRLPPKWNQQSGLYKRKFRKGGGSQYTQQEIQEALRKPAVIHYVGARKPWLPGCPHPLANRYWFYRKRLDVGGEPLMLKKEIFFILKKPHHFLRKLWYRLIFS